MNRPPRRDFRSVPRSWIGGREIGNSADVDLYHRAGWSEAQLQDGTSFRGGAGLTLEAVELGEAIFAVPVFLAKRRQDSAQERGGVETS